MYYVYIIYSKLYDKYYKGFTQFPAKRLETHNAGKSRYTKNYVPWEMIYIESFNTKTQALKREKVLKRYSKQQIKTLIKSEKNELKKKI